MYWNGRKLSNKIGSNGNAYGAGFRSLNDTWADTTTAHGRLMLTVLGGFAEFERELIRARTAEGRALAKANGVRLGRKPSPITSSKRRSSASRRARKRRARLRDPIMSAAGRFEADRVITEYELISMNEKIVQKAF